MGITGLKMVQISHLRTSSEFVVEPQLHPWLCYSVFFMWLFQVKNMIYHAVKDAVAVLKENDPWALLAFCWCCLEDGYCGSDPGGQFHSSASWEVLDVGAGIQRLGQWISSLWMNYVSMEKKMLWYLPRWPMYYFTHWCDYYYYWPEYIDH